MDSPVYHYDSMRQRMAVERIEMTVERAQWIVTELLRRYEEGDIDEWAGEDDEFALQIKSRRDFETVLEALEQTGHILAGTVRRAWEAGGIAEYPQGFNMEEIKRIADRLPDSDSRRGF
ncbi:hypothetical protein [Streptomyces sp. YS415]|uniref:hypothetical protein n=1 Tax=Streptomyces sp. YS415 TaxID=2944806 RepID=UPI002020BB57|nr:hypothetical protein [Streptomyces sp. YS415]MCL7429417.1 hypothetical protein [Streptomyces sp. YS415]